MNISRSKGVLGRSGQPDMAGNYERALEARKLLCEGYAQQQTPA
jgi:hypothetical protein